MCFFSERTWEEWDQTNFFLQFQVDDIVGLMAVSMTTRRNGGTQYTSLLSMIQLHAYDSSLGVCRPGTMQTAAEWALYGGTSVCDSGDLTSWRLN